MLGTVSSITGRTIKPKILCVHLLMCKVSGLKQYNERYGLELTNFLSTFEHKPSKNRGGFNWFFD